MHFKNLSAEDAFKRINKQTIIIKKLITNLSTECWTLSAFNAHSFAYIAKLKSGPPDVDATPDNILRIL